jgi:peptidoglycan/LPS O-acetylase OafA/YrhL
VNADPRMIGDPIRTEEPNAVTNRKTDCYSLLAAISYPFYVVHGIMGYVAMRIMLDHAIPPVAAVLLASALAVLVSIFIHIWVEIPTQQIGKRGLGWINGSSTQATFDSAALP